ncbi:MAG TPA: hypothetical protein VFO16_20770 [Pseudonocardiaceae bacterium]|nr:hypothetical protein [Pseudonocardiaceae bacterium]
MAEDSHPGPSRWLNGAVTGTLLGSVLVAALDHGGLAPDPVYDVTWIIITLAGTGLIRAYSSFVMTRNHREPIPRTALRTLTGEWALVIAGVPAVAILLGSSAGWYPTVTAVNVVLGVNVAMLFGWGALGARQAGYRPVPATLIGLADATVGMLIVLANVLLK